MTAQYVSTVLKRHAERAGLDSEEYSAHSLRAGFITQAIRAGEAERRVKGHSGHASWETFNQYVQEAGTFRIPPPRILGCSCRQNAPSYETRIRRAEGQPQLLPFLR